MYATLRPSAGDGDVPEVDRAARLGRADRSLLQDPVALDVQPDEAADHRGAVSSARHPEVSVGAPRAGDRIRAGAEDGEDSRTARA